MTPPAWLMTIWGWVRSAWARSSHDEREAVADVSGDEREPALIQDHPDRRARQLPAALVDGDERELVALRHAVDGGTAVDIVGPASGFMLYRDLAKAYASGERHARVEGASWTLDREKGALVLRTGLARVDLYKSRAKLSITALAAEVEGVDEWWCREVPRWLRALMGLEVEADLDDLDGLDRELAGIVVWRVLEQAIDLMGLTITREMQSELVTRSHVQAHSRAPGEVHALDVGTRRSPWSLGIYQRIKRLDANRQAERVAYYDQLIAGGWDGESEVVRVEPRRQRKGLRLERVDGSVLDATTATAGRRPELLQELFADSLNRVWRAEPGAAARAHAEGARLRDCPECPKWTRLRELATGGAPRQRYTQAARARQRAELLHHNVGRMVAAAASVEVLGRGDGDGELAVRTLRGRVGGPSWVKSMEDAEARHGEMVNGENR